MIKKMILVFCVLFPAVVKFLQVSKDLKEQYIRKSLVRFCISTILLISLFGCSSSNNIAIDNYDVALIGTREVKYYEIDGTILKLLDIKKIPEAPKADNIILSKSTKEFNIGTTLKNTNETKLRITQRDLTLKIIELEHTMPFSWHVNDSEILVVFAETNGVIIQKYDFELELKMESTITAESLGATTILPADIVTTENGVFMLAGLVNSVGINCKLLSLSDQLEVTEVLDIFKDNNTSGILKMEYYENKFYFAENNTGKTDDIGPIGSNRLIIYDIVEDKIEYIELNHDYPYELFLDKDNRNLIIQHYSLYVKEHVHTIYSIDDKSISEISFNEISDIDRIPKIGPNFYEFMFDANYYRYNPKTKETEQFSYEESNQESYPLEIF